MIRQGAEIVSICSKYTGNISCVGDKMLIRIGCEVHPADQWLSHGKLLAANHLETQWWSETGKAMLSFLISEANNYTKKYLGNNSKRDKLGRFCK